MERAVEELLRRVVEASRRGEAFLEGLEGELPSSIVKLLEEARCRSG